MQPLSPFEAAVLQWIAARSDDDALKRQLARATVAKRDHTGVGCYPTFSVPSDVASSTAPYADRGRLSGPCFESPAVEHGGGTVLCIEVGRVEYLEIFSYGDHFPADHAELGEFELRDPPPTHVMTEPRAGRAVRRWWRATVARTRLMRWWGGSA